MRIRKTRVREVTKNGSRLSERRAALRATRKGVQSIEIGMHVVSALAQSSGPLSLKALSSLTQLSKSRVHRYLASFARTELVAQNPVSGLYDLGPLALRLGFAAQNRVDALQRTLAAVERLAQESGHTAMVTSWSDGGPVILRWVQGAKPVYTTLSLGAILPLTRSATGRVYLAHLPSRLTQPILNRELRGVHSNDLEAQCRQTRENGFAAVSGNLIPGLIAVAAPVFDGRRDLCSVLTLIGRVAEGFSAREQAALLRVARNVSRELGAPL
jgi:DNA-binding IclR family transcriptional regulator